MSCCPRVVVNCMDRPLGVLDENPCCRMVTSCGGYEGEPHVDRNIRRINYCAMGALSTTGAILIVTSPGANGIGIGFGCGALLATLGCVATQYICCARKLLCGFRSCQETPEGETDAARGLRV
jgi:hypothetical protein